MSHTSDSPTPPMVSDAKSAAANAAAESSSLQPLNTVSQFADRVSSPSCRSPSVLSVSVSAEDDLLDEVPLYVDDECDVTHLMGSTDDDSLDREAGHDYTDVAGGGDDIALDHDVGKDVEKSHDSNEDCDDSSSAHDAVLNGHSSLYLEDELYADDELKIPSDEDVDDQEVEEDRLGDAVVTVSHQSLCSEPGSTSVSISPIHMNSSATAKESGATTAQGGGGGGGGSATAVTGAAVLSMADHHSSVYGSLASLDSGAAGMVSAGCGGGTINNNSSSSNCSTVTSAANNNNNTSTTTSSNNNHNNHHLYHHYHHQHLHHHTQPEQPDTKDGIMELCPVCGDRVSGYHYGLLTCESCKGFFKRTVQNKKVYTCVADKSCQIDKTQRKRCPFCRFQKCLDVGMKLEAVRVDRMRGGRNKFGPMYKRDRAHKMQLVRQRQLLGTPGSGSVVSTPTAPCAASLASPAADTAAVYAAAGGNGSHLQLPGGGAGLAGVATSLSLSYGTGTSSGGGHGGGHSVNIKQEIQYPVLSSTSASSPDSSPSPMACGLVNGASIGAHTGSSNGASPVPLSGPSLVHGAAGALLSSGAGVDQWNTACSPGVGCALVPPHTASTTSSSTSSSTASSAVAAVPSIIRELLSSVDDRDWQQQLFGLLQTQTYNQCEVDLFELLCKVLDTNLFAQVDWARNSIFFKDLRVEDQMKLLQATWSVLLIMDHIHQRVHNSLPDTTTLANGQKFDLLSLSLFGAAQLVPRLQQLVQRLHELAFDVADYICLKFTLLLDPSLQSLTSRRLVHQAQNQVKQAHLQYCSTMHPDIPNKYQRLLMLLPELRELALLGEEQLYQKHDTNSPTSLLIEMLHARRLVSRTTCQP